MLSPYPDIPQTIAPNTNNDYGTFKDDGTPGDHTGTPLNKDWPNDFYGALLSVLKAAGIEPNNTVENTTSSQFLTALQTLITGSGERTGAIRWELDPSDMDGWLLMDDTTIGNSSSAAGHTGDQYQALFNLIWAQTSNSNCPMFTSAGVPTSRGLSASDDWSANRQLSLPKQVGRTIAAAGMPSAMVTFAAAQYSDSFVITENLNPFTADDTTDILELTYPRSFQPGQAIRIQTTGALPSPLTEDTDYYPISVDETHIKLAASSSDAADNIAIDISDAGTGTNSIVVCEAIVSDTTNFNTGTLVEFATTGVLPAPLLGMTPYYAIVVDGSTLQFAASLSDAQNGIFIDITDAGSGTHTISTDELFTVSAGQSFPTGSKIQFIAHTGSLPSPLSVGVDYYINRIDASHFKVSTSRGNSVSGDSISFSTLGSGSHSVKLLFDTSYNVGASTGEQSHTQLESELATHTHPYTRYQWQYPQTGSSTSCWSGTSTQNTGAAGSSTPFNVMQPTTFYNAFIKL